MTEEAQQDDVRLRLFEEAPCDVFLVRTAGQVPRLQRFLVPMAGGPHARRALAWATDLADSNEGAVTALHIQRHVLAEQSGRDELARAVAAAGLVDHDRLALRVQHDAKVSRGISTVAEEHDVVLLGASDRMALSRALFGTIADHVLARQRGSVTIAVFRRADPMHVRLRAHVTHWLTSWVPQQQREERVALAAQLTEGSVVHFDFFALMFLATTIAGLGLIQNSTAVVVGAMLVAPLMTPIVGVSLGLWCRAISF
jgi:nucleotide-binding universal stress UspA family protein